MEILEINIKNLKLYENNSRIHSDFQIDEIAASIKEFGFTNPLLVDENNNLLAGHGRLLAARKLELDKVPVIQLSNLTEVQKKAYIIADNRIAMNSSWDEELLKQEVQSILEAKDEDTTYLELLGFNDEEIQQLLSEQSGGFKGKSKELEQAATELLEQSFESKLEIIVEVMSEQEQEQLYNEMLERGYKCRVLSI